jgi:hypothetical protein
MSKITPEQKKAFQLGYRQGIRDVFENHPAVCDELNHAMLLDFVFKSLDTSYQLSKPQHVAESGTEKCAE